MTELMVIFGIAAVLSSLLWPTFGGMQERAHTVKCTENLRQIGTALLNYAGEHDGTLPLTGDTLTHGAVTTGGAPGWTEQISPYLESDRRVFVCPASSKVLPGNRNYSYFLGTRAAYVERGGFAAIQLSKATDRARQIMGGDICAPMFDAADVDKDDSTQNPAFAASPAPFHKGTVNLLFCDGHVGNFKAWDDNQMTVRYSGTGGY
ncbi:hypothetical protein BH09VER1_BH09VER1_05100 [soil metagenome]